MRRIFGTYRYTWWQIAILKVALLAIGMIAGAFLAAFVMGWLWMFILVAVVGAGYILYVSFKPSPPTH